MASRKIEVLTRKDLQDLAVVGGGQDIIDWKLYDTLSVATGGSQLEFKYFQQAVGPNNITLEQTNMDIPAQLPNGVRFAAMEIEVQPVITSTFTKPDLQDLWKITHQGILTFNIGTRSYYQVPVLDCIGGGFYGFAAGFDAATSLAYASARRASNGKMEYAPVIPSTFNFNVTLDYPAAPSVAKTTPLRVLLRGKLIRPRQG